MPVNFLESQVLGEQRRHMVLPPDPREYRYKPLATLGQPVNNN